MGHRRRSNTAIRLEKMDKQRKAQTETQVVRLNPDEPIKSDVTFDPDTEFREKREASNLNVFSTTKLLEYQPIILCS